MPGGKSTVEPDRAVSRRSGIELALPELLGRDQPRRVGRLRRSERLVEIGKNVVDVLDADAEPDLSLIHIYCERFTHVTVHGEADIQSTDLREQPVLSVDVVGDV